MGKTVFQKMRDTKGIFHIKIGTIKDSNGMNLTEADLTSVLPMNNKMTLL